MLRSFVIGELFNVAFRSETVPTWKELKEREICWCNEDAEIAQFGWDKAVLVWKHWINGETRFLCGSANCGGNSTLLSWPNGEFLMCPWVSSISGLAVLPGMLSIQHARPVKCVNSSFSSFTLHVPLLHSSIYIHFPTQILTPDSKEILVSSRVPLCCHLGERRCWRAKGFRCHHPSGRLWGCSEVGHQRVGHQGPGFDRW